MSARPSTFEELAALPDDEVDVSVGVALLARDHYPGLDVGALIARLDDLAAPLAGKLTGKSPEEQAKIIVEYMYKTLGFSGNRDDYYDPKNSLLPDVLDRKLGIPISLAVVFCRLGVVAGARASGVGFPGHFLSRIDGDGPTVFVDPFDGRIVAETDLTEMLERVANQAGVSAVLGPEHLTRATPRAVLQRWLMNLRGVYLTRGDHARALVVLDRLVSLHPRDPNMLRERGLLAARLGAIEAARSDLSRAMELSEGDDVAAIRAELDKLGKRPAVLS